MLALAGWQGSAHPRELTRRAARPAGRIEHAPHRSPLPPYGTRLRSIRQYPFGTPTSRSPARMGTHLPAHYKPFFVVVLIGMSKVSRLPRRFDSVMKTLRELMNSKSERTRLQAALRASEILLEHRRAEERVTIATERAAARKAEAEAGADATGQPNTAPASQTAEEAARAFLASITKSTDGEMNAAV